MLQGILQFHQHSPPWAHRDIKPANVLLGPGDLPVLMDFGSTAIARKKINTRQEALLLQEDAAQNCSMPYRAPELFDVPSSCDIDERTDVWSLGCTLYALLFGYSPFECEFDAAGRARVVECSALRVLNPPPWPPAASRAPHAVALIKACLMQQAAERPFVADVVARVDTAVESAV